MFPRVDSVWQAPPKVLSIARRAGGMVEVTYALPGLRRAVVAVPEHLWQRGVHERVPAALIADLAALDSQSARIAGSIHRAAIGKPATG